MKTVTVKFLFLIVGLSLSLSGPAEAKRVRINQQKTIDPTKTVDPGSLRRREPTELAYTLHHTEFNGWLSPGGTVSVFSDGGAWWVSFQGNGEAFTNGPSVHLPHGSAITGMKAIAEFNRLCTDEDEDSDTFGRVTLSLGCQSLDPGTGYDEYTWIPPSLIITSGSATTYEGRPSALTAEALGKFGRIDVSPPHTFVSDREFCTVMFHVKKGARCGIALKPVSVLYRAP